MNNEKLKTDNSEGESFIEIPENQARENIPNVKDFAGDKIVAIDSSSVQFMEAGKIEANNLVKKFNPSSEIAEKYQKMLDLISEKANALAIQSKKRITQLVVGASMLSATSAIADTRFSKQNDEKITSDTNIELIQNKGIRAIPTGNGISEDNKSMPEPAPMENITQKERKMNEVEDIKKEIIEQIASGEYLQKLTREFAGNEKKALKEQNKRMQNVQTVKIVIKKLKEINDETYKTDKQGLFKGKTIGGTYEHNKTGSIHEVHIPSDFFDFGETIAHELWHASTRGVDEISTSAKKALSAGYLKTGEKDDKYFSNATEMLVRKKALELDMQRLGIKKYSEHFTKDHYDKLLNEQKGLSYDSLNFLKRVKYEHLKKILDNIAKNDTNEDNNVNV